MYGLSSKIGKATGILEFKQALQTSKSVLTQNFLKKLEQGKGSINIT